MAPESAGVPDTGPGAANNPGGTGNNTAQGTSGSSTGGAANGVAGLGGAGGNGSSESSSAATSDDSDSNAAQGAPGANTPGSNTPDDITQAAPPVPDSILTATKKILVGLAPGALLLLGAVALLGSGSFLDALRSFRQ
ncbi:hypothetical protein [Gordonia rhizosphera]|uniref:Uncharacterized protein n=1 Tax=Gordonia rhizosphera NBRC 16068 TaxID=1108045 RepID=K6VVI4_9ACTN|nr:hypothetical protein [Gordonia rhizosphera]GAB90890.1 hypothetical protein GORHZ_119_00170 [Gordonia rhizosphera NBRC 16068]